MGIYLCFAVPVITIVICALFYLKKLQWWEPLLLFAISTCLVLLGKHIAVRSLTTDEEYLGGYVQRVQYYEDWDEEVPCRHPIYCTRSCGKNCVTTYVCGHVHLYDVDYHPEHWVAVTTLGSYNITKETYQRLVRQFKVPTYFVDLHRDYHAIDGDMYEATWTGDELTLEPVSGSELYENKPKASLNIFHFDPPDSFELSQYQPFEYPKITSPWTQKTLLGYEDRQASRDLQVLNALLGAPKELRVFLLVFKDKTREAAYVQERYWQGGNKNEYVICIGIDGSTGDIKWNYPFSWTEKKETIVELRSYIEGVPNIRELPAIVQATRRELAGKWKRKNFHDFDYLAIEPTLGQTLWILFCNCLVCGGVAVWIVKNEFTVE